MKAFLKKEAPKRSANSFMLFATQQRPLLMAEQPGRNVKELSKLLGEKWRTLPAKAKEAFQDQAAAKRAAYVIELNKFKPRRDTYESELRAQLGLDPQKKGGVTLLAEKKKREAETGPIKSQEFQAPTFLADDFELKALTGEGADNN